MASPSSGNSAPPHTHALWGALLLPHYGPMGLAEATPAGVDWSRVGHRGWDLGYSDVAAGARSEGLGRRTDDRRGCPGPSGWPGPHPPSARPCSWTQAGVEHVLHLAERGELLGGPRAARGPDGGTKMEKRGPRRHSPSSPTHTAHTAPSVLCCPFRRAQEEKQTTGKARSISLRPQGQLSALRSTAHPRAGGSRACWQGQRGCGCEPVGFPAGDVGLAHASDTGTPGPSGP